MDAYLPLRGAHALLKRAGMSKTIVRLIFQHITSDRYLRRGFAGYTPTGRDVFVATYMKSGTNWTMQIAAQIAHRGAADFGHIHDIVPWPDTPGPGPVALDDAAGWAGSPTGLRVIKTHAPARFVPFSPDAKYITVLRDPKEVAVSSYYFGAALMGVIDTLTPSEWLALLTEGDRDTWVEHTLSWWALRDRPNVLVLTFPEMKRDLPGAVDKIAALMGVSLTAPERDAVIARSSLGWMKANNHRFSPTPLPFTTMSHEPDMIRRGKSGGSDELYSAAERARLDQRTLDALAARGSDFPYRALFDSLH